MSRLFLTIKKPFFDMIKDGIKLEEYREIKPYFDAKFSKQYTTLLLQNGYNKDSPRIEVEILSIGKGKANPAWSGGFSGKCYVIKLGKIISK